MNVLYYIDFKHGTLTSFPSTTHFKVSIHILNLRTKDQDKLTYFSQESYAINFLKTDEVKQFTVKRQQYKSQQHPLYIEFKRPNIREILIHYTPVKFIQNLKTKNDCAMISPSKQDVSTALKNLPLGLFGNPFFPSLLEHKKIFQWNAISHCILKEIK